MSAGFALSIAFILLVLLAAAVIIVAGLVRRPRREWQVAMMGQAQEVRYVGSSSTRVRPVKARRVSLDEMWAANSVAQSAYVGALKLPDREQVADALAPAPQAVLSQFRAPAAAVRPVVRAPQMTAVPTPPPPPRDYLDEDPFYEPDVVTGEVSLFNAAIERQQFDDARWEGMEHPAPAVTPRAGMVLAKEILATAGKSTATWISTQLATLREQWSRLQDSRGRSAGQQQADTAKDPGEVYAAGGGEAPPAIPAPPDMDDDLVEGDELGGWVASLESASDGPRSISEPHWRRTDNPLS